MLPREKATQLADLPHKFQGSTTSPLRQLGPCELCHRPLFEARHLAWEKAQADTTEVTVLPREIGV